MAPISDVARAKVRARHEQEMNDLVTVRRGGRGAFDPVTLRVSGITGAVTVYTGKAHGELVSPTGNVSLENKGEIAQRQCVVSIPMATDVDDEQPRVDDLLTFDQAEDPDLVQTSWRVVGVSGGGAWGAYRELSCAAAAKSRTWTGA